MRIVHISDIHVNLGSDFDEKMFNKAVKILNKIEKNILPLPQKQKISKSVSSPS